MRSIIAAATLCLFISIIVDEERWPRIKTHVVFFQIIFFNIFSPSSVAVVKCKPYYVYCTFLEEKEIFSGRSNCISPRHFVITMNEQLEGRVIWPIWTRRERERGNESRRKLEGCGNVSTMEKLQLTREQCVVYVLLYVHIIGHIFLLYFLLLMIFLPCSLI